MDDIEAILLDRHPRQYEVSQLINKFTGVILHIIKNTIGEEMWRPQGKGSIRYFGKNLVVTQSLLGFKLMEKATK